MTKTPDVRQISNPDLKRTYQECCEALAAGDPTTAVVRRYGIRDLGTLRRWLHRLEVEMDRRKLGYERASS
jgi:hypothetical protein